MKKQLDLKWWEEKIEKEGLAWELKGKLEKALNCYEHFLKELDTISPASQREINEKNAIIAYLLLRKAGILLKTGKIESGETLMNQALAYAEQSGNSLIIARVKLGLGVFYGSTRRFKEGEKKLKEALLSFNQSRDYDYRQGAGWALLNLGGLYGKQEKWDLANEKLTEAIELLKTIQNWVGVASAFELKAKFNTIRGNLKLAKEDMVSAILFFEKQGMKEKADSLRNCMNTQS
jgi:tetratricopeptide (TPR) repeat protein